MIVMVHVDDYDDDDDENDGWQHNNETLETMHKDDVLYRVCHYVSAVEEKLESLEPQNRWKRVVVVVGGPIGRCRYN